MFGIQPLLDYTKSKIKLSLVFEVVDDPEDESRFAACVKPLDVWFMFSKDSHELPLDAARFTKAGNDEAMHVPGLTKQTARDLRQWASLDTTYDRHYLYVLAQPPKEWRHLYGERQYKLRVSTGRAYNIAVSLPALPTNAATPSPSADAERPSAKKPGKLRL